MRPFVVALLAAVAVPSATAATSYHSYHLRWSSRVSQSATYRLSFRSARVRSIRLRAYGVTIPRGFVFDNIVTCVHRGPAFLDWDWAQGGGYVLIRVTMTTGLCNPGPSVAGTRAALTFAVST